MTNYPAQVFWSEEDDGFIAVAPDLPGCSAFGESKAEALVELDAAIDAWIEAQTLAGNPVPPASRLDLVPSASGKFLVRAPKSLHANLIREAASEGMSLNGLVVYLLTDGLARKRAPVALKVSYVSNGAPVHFKALEKVPAVYLSTSATYRKDVAFSEMLSTSESNLLFNLN